LSACIKAGVSVNSMDLIWQIFLRNASQLFQRCKDESIPKSIISLRRKMLSGVEKKLDVSYSFRNIDNNERTDIFRAQSIEQSKFPLNKFSKVMEHVYLNVCSYVCQRPSFS
jgi:hypothetical protein